MKTSNILTIGSVIRNDFPCGMIGVITASPTTQTATNSFVKEGKIVIKELPDDTFVVADTPNLPLLLVTQTNVHGFIRVESYDGINTL
jgi:hypothetical protein